MVKLFIYSILLIAFASCKSYRMLEGRSKPVYFTPDASVFMDTSYPNPAISYHDLLNLRGNYNNSLELTNGKTSLAIINEPSFFTIHDMYNTFLAYPGERLTVKGESGDYTVSTVKGNKHRDRELRLFKSFYELQKYPAFPLVPGLSLDSILSLEKQQKEKLLKAKANSKILYDSLIRIYGVSKKFKKITKEYPENRYDFGLFWFLRYYKDTLAAHHLYIDKCKQLIPLFNGITRRSKLNSVLQELNDLVIAIMPRIRVRDETEFRACFDSVETTFKALARDYLLSQLMYRAYAVGIEVPIGYLEKYKNYSLEKAYRQVVFNTKEQRDQVTKGSIDSSTNHLLTIDGKNTFSLENMLAQYKGKFVLIDFWATWCVPCRQEIPYWEKLSRQYPTDKIVFLSVSLDKEIQVWQKGVIASGVVKNYQYLWLNSEKSAFAKQYDVSTVPRYMLFDKEGKIINMDAPRPSEPAISLLLDKLIF